MYGAMIELLFFAVVAFFIINKLMSTLGTTDQNDPAKGKSFFGEQSKYTDVTSTIREKSAKVVKANFNKKSKQDLSGIILEGHEEEVKQGLSELLKTMPNFNIKNFAKGAQAAFKMIIDAANSEDTEEMIELIDKRYIAEFINISVSYGKCNPNAKIDIQISEIYTFGNSSFIKILFLGNQVVDKIDNFHEEWTFSKNNSSEAPNWYLSNIDKPH